MKTPVIQFGTSRFLQAHADLFLSEGSLKRAITVVQTSGAAARSRRLDEARQNVFDYIEMFYNSKRKHVGNGMLSPVEFEKQQKI